MRLRAVKAAPCAYGCGVLACRLPAVPLPSIPLVLAPPPLSLAPPFSIQVAAQYEEIGGSPIRRWTELQGVEMCKLLDVQRPESAPHKAYTGFRYALPYTETALDEMKNDGVEHVIAFSQFPQVREEEHTHTHTHTL